MNEKQIKKALDYLVENNSFVKARANIYYLDGEYFKNVLCGLDNYYTSIDFKQKKITISGWSINGHNGDEYGEEREEIAWSALEEISGSLEAMIVSCAEKVSLRQEKAKEEERRVLREKVIVLSVIGSK